MHFKKNIYNLQALNFIKNSNLRIGILGGTFNPAHFGHVMISIEALNFYKFDYIIWLVANQNPLKKTNKQNILTRANKALELATHPKILVSTAEYDLKFFFIYDSLKLLLTYFKSTKFTWLMGIDNLSNFTKWYKYKEIPNLCDIIIFDRPTTNRLISYQNFNLKTNSKLDKNQTNNIIIHRSKLQYISSTKIRNNE